MNEFLPHFPFADDEYAGHLKSVAQLTADPVTVDHPGGKAAHPDLQAEQLGEGAFRQPKAATLT